jgi:hypothetical protein
VAARAWWAPQGDDDGRREQLARYVQKPQFRADADKQHLALTPTSGEAVQRLVDRTMNAPPDIVAKTRAALAREQNAVGQKKP